MKNYYFQCIPRDQLFMRDARPMTGSDAGIGSNWPRPDQVYNALINAFHRTWPTLQPWEHDHRKGDHERPKSSCRFGGLKTAGPFLVDTATNQFYFPCPFDVSAENEKGGMITLHQMKLCETKGTNLPQPLTHAFISSQRGKVSPPQWLSLEEYGRYLKGHSFSFSQKALFDTEKNIGIAIDPTTHSTVESKFYQAEYLRLRPSAALAFCAECETYAHSDNGRSGADVFEKFAEAENISWDNGGSADIIMGGQQGVVSIHTGNCKFDLPTSLNENGTLIRWTLLTPAIFPALKENVARNIAAHPGGWLPTWIDPKSGQVMLPRGRIERQPGEDRESWRQRMNEAPKFTAKLIAARIGKPQAFSGWGLGTGPKPTMLAVPAGSVYVFDCPVDERQELSHALSWNGGDGNEILNRRSVIFGEKGYGLGVCSTIC